MNKFDNDLFSIDYPVIMGFEPLVNQRLLPPTFPRYSKILERDSAVEYFEGLVTRLKAVCEVTVLNSFHVILVSKDL